MLRRLEVERRCQQYRVALSVVLKALGEGALVEPCSVFVFARSSASLAHDQELTNSLYWQPIDRVLNVAGYARREKGLCLIGSAGSLSVRPSRIRSITGDEGVLPRSVRGWARDSAVAPESVSMIRRSITP